MKNNQHKKYVFQDNFIKRYCCSAINHSEGWAWWKRHNRKIQRRKMKQELDKELKSKDMDRLYNINGRNW